MLPLKKKKKKENCWWHGTPRRPHCQRAVEDEAGGKLLAGAPTHDGSCTLGSWGGSGGWSGGGETFPPPDPSLPGRRAPPIQTPTGWGAALGCTETTLAHPHPREQPGRAGPGRAARVWGGSPPRSRASPSSLQATDGRTDGRTRRRRRRRRAGTPHPGQARCHAGIATREDSRAEGSPPARSLARSLFSRGARPCRTSAGPGRPAVAAVCTASRRGRQGGARRSAQPRRGGTGWGAPVADG